MSGICPDKSCSTVAVEAAGVVMQLINPNAGSSAKNLVMGIPLLRLLIYLKFGEFIYIEAFT
jgi:hypothetical protein